jgi:hypothetical protein
MVSTPSSPVRERDKHTLFTGQRERERESERERERERERESIYF